VLKMLCFSDPDLRICWKCLVLVVGIKGVMVGG
jgi:hypothetical protein